MHILLCKGTLAGPVSGADEAFVSYAVKLQATGHRLSILLFYRPRTRDPYLARLRAAGITVSCISSYPYLRFALTAVRDRFLFLLPPGPQRRVLAAWQRLARLSSGARFRRCRARFKTTPVDVIHVVTPDAAAVTMIRAAHATKIPVLYQELGTPRHLPALADHYAVFTSVVPLCTEIAALSPGLARQWQQRFASTRPLSVLPLMLEDPGRGPSPARDVTAQPVFGFAARFEHGKGPLGLLEAFAHLRAELGRGVLRLTGVGPLEGAAKARARALGIGAVCDFLGYTLPEEKDAFIRGLDVFVLPSRAEGTPNSIIEAMAHGVPIVASDVGGIADMLGPDAGVVVPADDVEALAEAMLRLAVDPALRASMGRAARARYEELFLPDAVLPVLVDTYRRVAGRVAPGDPPRHPWATLSA